MPDIPAHITGTVWKIEVAVGDQVDLDDTVVILESMKMEMPVEAEDSGTVTEIRCAEGQSVSEGDVLVVLDSITPTGSSASRPVRPGPVRPVNPTLCTSAVGFGGLTAMVT